MNISQISGLPFRSILGFLVAGWLAAEIAAFLFIAHSIGVFWALLLGIGTSLIGLADSRSLFAYLRRRAARPKSEDARGALFDGALQALGAFLLILPGFASDFVGLALKSPSVRLSVAKRLAARTIDPRFIDLAPGEWKRIGPKRAARKRASSRTAAAE